MAARLGNALLWASLLIAVGVVWVGSDGDLVTAGPKVLGLGAIIVLLGWVAQYVLAGGKKPT